MGYIRNNEDYDRAMSYGCGHGKTNGDVKREELKIQAQLIKDGWKIITKEEPEIGQKIKYNAGREKGVGIYIGHGKVRTKWFLGDIEYWITLWNKS